MSPEAREAAQALADALWETWRQDVGQARPRAQIAAYVADPARFIEAAGGDMARAALRRRPGRPDRRPHRLRPAHGRARRRRRRERAGQLPRGPLRRLGRRASGRAIAAARSACSPSPARSSTAMPAPGTAGGETVARNLERGLERGNLRALVVRVDSPGGSVLASERIRRAILRGARRAACRWSISMGSVAASGGYWIATAGDIIFAEPSTITGSIGVFGILPSFEGTLQRLGVGADGVRTTPLSGEPDLLRGPSPEADRLLQMGVESTYRRFVAPGRRARGGCRRRGSTRSRRAGSGTAAPPASSASSTGSARWTTPSPRRRGGPRSIPPTRGRSSSRRSPASSPQIVRRRRARRRASEAPRDAFARLARRPEAMIERALHDAQRAARRPGDPGALPRMPGDRAGAARRGAPDGLWARLLALLLRG